MLEWTAPFVKVHGLIYAFKSFDSEDEFKSAKNSMTKLSTRLKSSDCYITPFTGRKRVFYIFEKTAPTDNEYPRRTSVTLNHPL